MVNGKIDKKTTFFFKLSSVVSSNILSTFNSFVF